MYLLSQVLETLSMRLVEWTCAYRGERGVAETLSWPSDYCRTRSPLASCVIFVLRFLCSNAKRLAPTLVQTMAPSLMNRTLAEPTWETLRRRQARVTHLMLLGIMVALRIYLSLQTHRTFRSSFSYRTTKGFTIVSICFIMMVYFIHKKKDSLTFCTSLAVITELYHYLAHFLKDVFSACTFPLQLRFFPAVCSVSGRYYEGSENNKLNFILKFTALYCMNLLL